MRYPLFVTAVALFAVSSMPRALAQSKPGMRPGTPMYDTKTEERVTGAVEAVQNVSASDRGNRPSRGGTHLTVKTSSETLDVHLGPTMFLKEKKIDLAKGDKVEILGSRTKINDRPVLLAREITKGENTWALRDASGRPLWSRRRR